MRYVSFASGSSGNCGLLQGGGVSLLVDAGLSLKRIRACLADEGLALDELNGILVTHEHSDHVAGLAMVSKYTNLPMFMSGGTARALLRQTKCREESLRTIEAGVALTLGELRITAFETPHDAAQPFGFRVEGETGTLAFVTDLGYVTRSVREASEGCTAAVVEANYDLEMLRCGPYPLTLKRRIQGNFGHLDNLDAAELCVLLAETGVKQLLLAHLSKENNLPELARETVNRRLKGEVPVRVAPRDDRSDELEI
ncbi:MAG: MBL fold metallo-hydrolase [Oscillospiraceae bacterium]|nr:MBL fold metallo-hydrolase [Oscillospiraceae bacterium]